MKKVTYLLVLMFSLVLTSASCDKSDDPTPEQTLEQMYPDWSNLTWVSTNGETAQMNPNIYPRISFTIVGDLVNFKVIKNVVGAGIVTYNFNYGGLEVTTTTATLFLPDNAKNQTFDLLERPDNNKIQLIWEGNTYILLIN